MKTKILHLVTALIILLSLLPAYASDKSNAEKQNTPKSKTVKLFNGKNLKNWEYKLRDASVDPATVFTVQNKVIHIKGDPFGYMRTKEIYSDYKLHLEWRWSAEATNSGVFVHGQLPDAIWLKCVECQLKAGSAGDFVCMNGADMKEHINKANMSVKKMAESSEKPTGEWNSMDVVCDANTIEVYINGVLQNKGTEVTVSEGHICLQSEGKEVEFRNIFLSKLK